MRKKLLILLGSGFGLSLASIGIYLLFRKKGDEEETDEMKMNAFIRSQPIFKVNRQMTSFKIKVPKLVVPKIIGRSGENIKEIERQTNAYIRFDDHYFTESSDAKDKTSKQSNDESDDWEEFEFKDRLKEFLNEEQKLRQQFRFINIRGSQESIRNAELIINGMIADNLEKNISDAIHIPFGCNIVGPNGQIVADIEAKSGARVIVKGSRHDKDRFVIIRGTDSQRNDAKHLIETIFKSFVDHNEYSY